VKAARWRRYGDPLDVVTVEDVDPPAPPTGDQVVVRVQVAALNRADLDQLGPRPGFLRLFMGLRGPRNHRLGIDAAGVVEAVGPEVTRFRPGDRVFADLFPFGMGALAELAIAPDRAWLPIPDGLATEAAATLPHSAILAIQGLRRGNRAVGPGDRVLIDGASGNVGPFAVQLAKLRGAHVTGVCRTAKVDFVRSLGADRVIDYTREDYTRGTDRFDWILAADSHYPMLRVRRVLKPGGTYATLGGGTAAILEMLLVGPVVSLATGKHLGLMLGWKPFARADAEELAGLVLEGRLRPPVDRTFPLAEVAQALDYLDRAAPPGKVLVTIQG
jgi:NADPH:quinone reductase-like Zn-dependent oxidoreductase